MRAQAEVLTRWFVGGLLMASMALAVPIAAAVDDARDIQNHEQQLQAKARELDADAARATSTPDGPRRLTERIAKQFKVQSSVVTDVRARTGSYGQATIALALSEELMKRDKSLGQQTALNTILAERQAGKGWGVIAHDLGLKLGHVISEVKKADKAAEHVAGKPDKADKDKAVAKAEKPEKPEKVDKPEKPAKPEKPGR
jgi:hypothetical protein